MSILAGSSQSVNPMSIVPGSPTTGWATDLQTLRDAAEQADALADLAIDCYCRHRTDGNRAISVNREYEAAQAWERFHRARKAGTR